MKLSDIESENRSLLYGDKREVSLLDMYFTVEDDECPSQVSDCDFVKGYLLRFKRENYFVEVYKRVKSDCHMIVVCRYSNDGMQIVDKILEASVSSSVIIVMNMDCILTGISKNCM